jgi:hypothetical protein
MTPYERPMSRTVKQTIVAVALVPVYIVVVAYFAVHEVVTRGRKIFIANKAHTTNDSTFNSASPFE